MLKSVFLHVHNKTYVHMAKERKPQAPKECHEEPNLQFLKERIDFIAKSNGNLLNNVQRLEEVYHELKEKLEKFNRNSRERDSEMKKTLTKDINEVKREHDDDYDQLRADLMGIDVKFKAVHPDAVPPKYSTDGAAGLDLTVVDIDYDKEKKVYIYHTGWACEIPEGFVGLLAMRSSVYKKTVRQADGVGIIDADYRDEILAIFEENAIGTLHEQKGLFKRFKNTRQEGYTYDDKVVQLVIVPAPRVSALFTDKLSETNRTGGFGSTDEEPIDNEVM